CHLCDVTLVTRKFDVYHMISCDCEVGHVSVGFPTRFLLWLLCNHVYPQGFSHVDTRRYISRGTAANKQLFFFSSHQFFPFVLHNPTTCTTWPFTINIIFVNEKTLHST